MAATTNEYRVRGYLSANEAARRLGVQLRTLYAYVSRGLVTSHRAAGTRVSFFHPEEIERLRARPSRSRRPELGISSAITLLRHDRLFYRGLDAITLSQERRYEEVAELLWHGNLEAHVPWVPADRALVGASAVLTALPDVTLPLERLSTAVAAMGPCDPLRFNLTTTSVVPAGRSLIAGMVSSLPRLSRLPTRGQGHRVCSALPLAANLAAALSTREPVPELIKAINVALILTADHELAPSTLAARIAASTRAPMYAAVAAGLAVLHGPRHGATSLWVEDLLQEIEAGATPEQAVAEHMRRGEYVFGFGHPIYEGSDPRGSALLEAVVGAAPTTGGRNVESLMTFSEQHGLAPPNVDFALAALAHRWQLVRGAGQAIFAVGRTVGWIAHAIEEYERPSQYRIRALYSGSPPIV